MNLGPAFPTGRLSLTRNSPNNVQVQRSKILDDHGDRSSYVNTADAESSVFNPRRNSHAVTG
jgi:hypothetical protein